MQEKKQCNPSGNLFHRIDTGMGSGSGIAIKQVEYSNVIELLPS